MELDARLGKPCNKILRNLIHVHKYVLAYACVYVARCQRMLQAYVTDVVEYVFMFLENISTFLKKDNRLLKKDKGVLKKGQHVSAYMPIMFSVHYSITKPIFVSIRPTTGIKPLYTTIATVTMNLIVSAAIVLLNPYVTVYISYKIPPFALSVHIPDVSTSIYVEVDSKVLLGLPSCDKAFVR